MDLQLNHKVAVVTGSSRGIGRAIAEKLSSEGVKVVLAARSENDLKDVAQHCKTETRIFATDLKNPQSPEDLIAYCIKEFGTIDFLVNNAGATKRGNFFDLTEDDWSDGFALKFYSTILCSKAAWSTLMKNRGSIINIIGVGGRIGKSDFAIGGAVNAALMNFTKVLSELGMNDGVKVNAINPGSIATDRLKKRIENIAHEKGISKDKAASVMAQQLNVNRFGDPSDIANAVAFLASPVSDYCQGLIMDVDGGQTRAL